MGKGKLHWIRWLVLFMLLFSYGPLQASAETVFTEDFSSGTFDAWSNAALDDDPETEDNDLLNVATIQDGMLYVNNKATGGSFYYIAPKDIKAKNFTISMRVKTLDFTGSWFGFSVRKDINDRFNGSNNVLHTFIANEGGIEYQAYRGYPGGGGVVALTKQTTQASTFTDELEDWHTYTLTVQDHLFTAEIDGQVVGVVEYENSRINEAGYISINVCVGEVYIDDVKLVVHDEDDGSTQPDPSQAEPGAPADHEAPANDDEDSVPSDDSTGQGEAGNGDQETTSEPAEGGDGADEAETDQAEARETAAPPAEEPESGSSSGAIWAVVVALAIVAAGGGGYVWIKSRKK